VQPDFADFQISLKHDQCRIKVARGQ